MSNLLEKFKCSECGIVGSIELVQDDAWAKARVLDDPEGDIMYEETEVCDYHEAFYRCGDCDQKIDCDPDTESLIKYLKEL